MGSGYPRCRRHKLISPWTEVITGIIKFSTLHAEAPGTELTICPQMRVQHATFEFEDGTTTTIPIPIPIPNPSPSQAIPLHDVVIWDCVTIAHFSSQKIELNLRCRCSSYLNWWVWWVYNFWENARHGENAERKRSGEVFIEFEEIYIVLRKPRTWTNLWTFHQPFLQIIVHFLSNSTLIN